MLLESFQQSATVDSQTKVSSTLEQQTATLQAETILSDKEKGDAFEKFVLSLFDLESERFRIIDWRSDKITDDGHYAMSNHHPDIVLELKKSAGCYRFAVECKWRSDYQNGTIEWAKEYQIRNYQNFQQEMKMPVFIVIGVGGMPAAPKHMHVVALNQVAKYTVLFQSTLNKYTKYVPSSFYYDPYQNTLT